jgi:hypothetical protein
MLDKQLATIAMGYRDVIMSVIDVLEESNGPLLDLANAIKKDVEKVDKLASIHAGNKT